MQPTLLVDPGGLCGVLSSQTCDSSCFDVICAAVRWGGTLQGRRLGTQQAVLLTSSG